MLTATQYSHCISTAETNQLMLLKEIIAVYCGRYTEQNCSEKQYTFQMFKEAVHVVIVILHRV